MAATLSAATSLSPGDIAIVGYASVNPDEFSFVTFVDLSANTVIKFTDNGWKVSGHFRYNEGFITWTSPATTVTAGTVIWINKDGTSLTTNYGSVTSSGSFLLSIDGDQILAFQGDTSNPVFVYALNNEDAGVWQSTANDSHTSALPTGLTNGSTAVALDEVDNALYSGGTTGSHTQLLGWISDKNNWSGSNSRSGYDPSSDGPQSFTITQYGLPVQLVSFTAKHGHDGIMLEWRTASEDGNDYFGLERSNDGVYFETIGIVPGHGTTGETHDYAFMDENPLPGLNYYRLRQNDFNGDFTYSPIVFANIASPAVQVQGVYPNPASSELTLQINSQSAVPVILELIDYSGKIVYSRSISIETGINTINLSIDQYPPGLYLLQLRDGENQWVLPVTKQ